MCEVGREEPFDELSAWIFSPTLTRHRDELSSQRGFSTCRMTPALKKIRKIRQIRKNREIRKTPVQYHTSVENF